MNNKNANTFRNLNVLTITNIVDLEYFIFKIFYLC